MDHCWSCDRGVVERAVPTSRSRGIGPGLARSHSSLAASCPERRAAQGSQGPRRFLFLTSMMLIAGRRGGGFVRLAGGIAVEHAAVAAALFALIFCCRHGR